MQHESRSARVDRLRYDYRFRARIRINFKCLAKDGRVGLLYNAAQFHGANLSSLFHYVDFCVHCRRFIRRLFTAFNVSRRFPTLQIIVSGAAIWQCTYRKRANQSRSSVRSFRCYITNGLPQQTEILSFLYSSSANSSVFSINSKEISDRFAQLFSLFPLKVILT